MALVAGHFFVTENSLLNYRTTLCNCILPYVVVFVIVIVLYKYIYFDLRATVGCFVASNLASLPQRLFLNVHVWDSRYIKTYPSHSACELSDSGGVQVSLISSFKSTRSYAALRAADLDWIVGPGYSLGRVHSGEKP